MEIMRAAIFPSRDNKVPFYEKLGDVLCGEEYINGDTFRCVRMEKQL